MISDWTRPFEPDAHTVALYHFNEGEGDEARDACGDPELTLRSGGRALWGSRPGFGSTARFERSDANLRIGPANHDKLQLRTCTEEWTVEAWVRYTGPGGKDRGQWSRTEGRRDPEEDGTTYAFICGTDEEGFSLPRGMRGGWSFILRNGATRGTREDGLIAGARFMGWVGRDPNHDTSSSLGPSTPFGWLDEDRGRFRDTGWHHVAWQFRHRDQMNYLLVDGRLVRKVQLPAPGHASNRLIVNDAERCDIPFCVGGVSHSRDPVVRAGLEMGNMDGEIDELRISSVMRYPVTDRLTVIRQKPSEAGLGIPYEVRLGADAAAGTVSWDVKSGSLPAGLAFDAGAGVIRGTPEETVESRRVTIGARDEEGATDDHTFSFTVRRGRLLTESLPTAYVGAAYQAALTTEHMADPLTWQVAGAVPAGLSFDGTAGCLSGTPVEAGRSRLSVQVTDANGLRDRGELLLRVLPEHLRVIGTDEHTVALYDWQGPDGRLFEERSGRDRTMTLTYTNIGGDRRLRWPGREGRFPQETGHGEHGYVNIGKEWGSLPEARAVYESVPELDLKTCTREWTVEAWVRRGGPWQGFGDLPLKRFDYGHICGTYDSREQGVWELYLSDLNSPDAGMAPGVHFQSRDHAWTNLHPWMRPRGIVAEREEVGIGDTEWHHVAWQYGYAEDEHELFLDGTPIWRMRNADGRRLVNDREHGCQFSVFTRLTGYAKYGGGFNYLGWGNFFGQIGEIRISGVRRY